LAEIELLDFERRRLGEVAMGEIHWWGILLGKGEN
jgi:hypothetical protein